jgi:FkbM family methyltransferase
MVLQKKKQLNNFIMKKYLYIAASLLLTITMQAQDRPMPKQGPAPSINIKKPVTFVLENGLKVLVVENNKLPRVSYNLTLDNTPFAEGSKKGVTDLVSAMIGNATESISKDKFNEEIDFLGANINFYESGASANGLSRYSARILELLADGALNPLFTQEDFDAERAKLIEGLKSDEKSASAIASRVQNVLTFGKEHYNGEFTSEETLKNVTLQDVINHYNTYFVPANAYLVIIGDVKTKDVKKKVEQLFFDKKSKYIYNSLFNWFSNVRGNFLENLDIKYTYFDPTVYIPIANEHLIDCGAYTGDTLLACPFPLFKYDGFEPDTKNYLALINNKLMNNDNYKAWNCAVGASDRTVKFSSNGNMGSKIANNIAAGSKQSIDIEMCRIDSKILNTNESRIIKMDLEGYELEALEGCKKLDHTNTIFAITTYHKLEHLFEIPLMLHKLAPFHKLFFRTYGEDWFETIAYAVPENRIAR